MNEVSATMDESLSDLPLPPHAKGEPILGHARAFLKDGAEALCDLAREHGPLVRFNLGPKKLTLVTAPKDVLAVYADPERYSKGSDSFRQIATWLGESVVTSPGGATWKHHRRLIQPSFHKNALYQLMPKLQTALDTYIEEEWEANIVGKGYIDMENEMLRMTMRLVGEALLSVDLLGDYKNVSEAFNTSSLESGFRARHPFRFLDKLPIPRNIKYAYANRYQDSVIRDMINQRRNDSSPPQDFLQMFIEAQDSDAKFSDQEVLDEVKSFIAAGNFTTATAMHWVFYMLCVHEDVKEKVMAEIEAVVGDADLEKTHIDKLEYLQQVIYETMRIYPPSWAVSRLVEKDGELGGHLIQAGEEVVLSAYVVHHDPKIWQDPGKFDPDRFQKNKAPKPSDFVYFPFGGGPRVCAGSNYALIEMKMVLVNILRKYSFSVKEGFTPVLNPGLSLRPRVGAPIRFDKK